MLFLGPAHLRLAPKTNQQISLLCFICPQSFIKMRAFIPELLRLKQKNYLQNGRVETSLVPIGWKKLHDFICAQSMK